MSKLLGIEIMDFERAVVHVRRGIRGHEECVMVHISRSSVDVCEYRYILPLLRTVWARYIEEVRRYEVEVAGIPRKLIVELLNA